MAGWVAVYALLPYDPVKYVLFAVFWAVYTYVFVNDPERLPLMVILGLPAMTFAPHGSGIPIVLVNNHTIFVLCLAVALILIRKKEPLPLPRNPLVAPVVYYGILIAASVFISHLTGSARFHTWELGWHNTPLRTLLQTAKTLVVFPFLGPIAFRLLRSRDNLRATVHVIAISSMLVSLENLWHLRSEIASGTVDAYSRAEGFVGEPNDFGGYLALVISILIPLFIDGKLTRFERLLFGVTLCTAGAALLFTLSRGSWLALMAGLGFFAMIRGAKAIAFLLVLALTATFWMPQAVIDRVANTVMQNDEWVQTSFAEDQVQLDSSSEGRIEHWTELIDQWASSPLYGHGFGSYHRLWNRISPRTGYSTSAHSSIIEMTAEEGTLGFIAYFWLIWSLARGATKIVRMGPAADPDGFYRPLSYGMIAAATCLVVLDTSAARFNNPLLMANMWLLAGGVARLRWEMERVQAAALLSGIQRRRPRSRQATGKPVRRPDGLAQP